MPPPRSPALARPAGARTPPPPPSASGSASTWLSLLDASFLTDMRLGSSDVARLHKTGEIAYFGDEGENVRVLGGIKKEQNTEKQRELPVGITPAVGITPTKLEEFKFCYGLKDESGYNDVTSPATTTGTVVAEGKASTYESSPLAIVV